MAEAFDPDKFLAEKPFDPDAFLAEAPLSAGDRLRKALVEKQRQQPMAGHTALSETILDEATLKATRPLTSALAATVGGITGEHPGTSWGERYSAHKAALDERAAKAQQQLGWAGPSVSAVSSLPANYFLGGGSTLATIPQMMARSTIPAAIEGASGAPPGEELKGAVKGAGTAAALTGAFGSAVKSLNPAEWRGAAAEATAARGLSPEAIKASAKTLYSQLDNAGIAYDPSQTSGLYTALHDMRNSGRFSPNANPTLVDHFDQLM